jgi:hypothetical protein
MVKTSVLKGNPAHNVKPVLEKQKTELTHDYIVHQIKRAFSMDTEEVSKLLKNIERYADKCISPTNMNKYSAIAHYTDKKLARLTNETRIHIIIELSQE